MQIYNSKTIHELETLGKSKGEFFETYEETFDYALPQDWLDTFADWCIEHKPKVTYHLILSSTVWAYPPEHKCFGIPITCCCEVLLAWKTWQKFLEKK